MSETCINTFRLGTDPEFMLLNGNGTTHNFSGSSREIGADHGGAVVELRPLPSYSVNGLLANVKTLLESNALSSVRSKTWRAGAFHNEVSMGGHIHIEVPFQYSPNRSGQTIPAVSPEVFNARMEACDHITKAFEEANLLPKQECALRRDRGSYGRFGVNSNHHQVVDPHTNIQRVEYRSPCSWLFDPRNAFLLITGLKLATVSPVAVMKSVPLSDPEKIFQGLLKLYRNFQHIDQDSYMAANKICRTSNPENLERLIANPEVDFKINWKLNTTPSAAGTR